MGGKSSSQTIGYHFMFDILFGLGRGPWNSLKAIKVGDKIAWEGSVTDDTVNAIQSPNLFGGEKKEGGIQGPFRAFFGRADQGLPGAGSANCGFGGPMSGVQTLPAVKTTIGGLISEFRGTMMLWFSGLVTSMNPYPKQWEFRGDRYSAGWYNDTCWYPVMANIALAGGTIQAMNPSHIIFECFTNPQWGRGYTWSQMDENSFIYAANKLCEEGFGLCFVWQRKEQNVDEFIAMVCDYISAVWYTDPETGKITLRLIRDDYVADDLPLFSPTTGLIDIVEDDSTAADEAFNQVVGTGRDPVSNDDFSVRVYNLAARIAQNAPNTQDKDYKGIPTKDLMARVLMRDLRITALGLRRFKVVLDRRGWKLRPGMPFRISDTRKGIGELVVRVGQIEDKSFKDGRITVSAMQDVFGISSTSFVGVVDSTWTPPTQEAAPAAEERLLEANYRDLILRRDPSDIQALNPTDSIIGVVALSPDPVMYQYDLATRVAGEPAFSDRGTGSFTGAATLVSAITPLQTTFVVTGESSFDANNVGQAILVDDEQMQFVAYDSATHTVTVERGVADTIPAAHSAGAILWTIDDDLSGDGRKYADGETVEAKVLTRTAGDLLTEAEAATMSLEVGGRQARPYPPGNIKVDGILAMTPLPSNATGHAEPLITWNHRDRILQENQLVGHTDGSVGPEPGTTYNIRLYDNDDPLVVLRSTAAIAGTSWTYDAAMQTADGNPDAVWVELESERDGLTSFQKYRFLVWIQSGYGYGYGYNYGGAV